jgi:ATP-binding cassette subfamily B protein
MNARSVLSWAKPCLSTLALALLCMLLESGIALGLPLLGGRFAAVLLEVNTDDTVRILAPILLLLALQALLRCANANLVGSATQQLGAELRKRVHAQVLALPLPWLQRHRQGDLLALLTHETDALSDFISSTVLSIPVRLFTVAGAVILMWLLEPLLALLVSALVPLFYLLLRVLGRRLRPLSQSLQEEYAAGVAQLEENLALLPAIKSFTREAFEAQRYGMQVERIRALSMTQLRIQAVLDPLLQFITAAAVVLLLWLAAGRMAGLDGSQGEGLQLPELVSFLLYAALLTRPVAALAGVYGQWQVARGALARIQSLLAEPPEAAPQGCTEVLPRVQGDIRFERVSFAHPGRDLLLRDLDLHVRAGETIALTGENGCGKSTVVQLLLCLLRPASGRILLDGIDLVTLDPRDVRRQISVVSQQILLGNDSIAANIAWARPGASMAEIEAASRLALLHDFVKTLPEGYSTLIGDRGIRLSGGQQQRLALARALLKAAPILILDEATAMFDPAAEADMIGICRQVLQPLTVILITHRPASLALADRVLRLQAGRIQMSITREKQAQPC